MKKLKMPLGVNIVQGPSGPRFRGDALGLIQLAENLRSLHEAPIGSRFKVGSTCLVVAAAPLVVTDNRVHLPPDAWNIAASKFIEVATGREESPFDFSMCGYLWPPAEPDIGVELVGEPIPD